MIGGSGCVPARDGARGGTATPSTARYFFTVRQSTPHCAAISV